MGKKKTNKKKNVFKVAGAKSLKPKKKAKPFTGNIKKIKETLKDNVRKIDQDLVSLEKSIRSKNEEKVHVKIKNSGKNEKLVQEDASKLEKDSTDALQKLHEMTF